MLGGGEWQIVLHWVVIMNDVTIVLYGYDDT